MEGWKDSSMIYEAILAPRMTNVVIPVPFSPSARPFSLFLSSPSPPPFLPALRVQHKNLISARYLVFNRRHPRHPRSFTFRNNDIIENEIRRRVDETLCNRGVELLKKGKERNFMVTFSIYEE